MWFVAAAAVGGIDVDCGVDGIGFEVECSLR